MTFTKASKDQKNFFYRKIFLYKFFKCFTEYFCKRLQEVPIKVEKEFHSIIGYLRYFPHGISLSLKGEA